MLANSTQNDELQNYLNEKAYETASLGETSADELSVVPPEQQAATVDFYRDSDQNRSLKERMNLAQSVQDYEAVVVQDHLGLDLYRSKNKTYK